MVIIPVWQRSVNLMANMLYVDVVSSCCDWNVVNNTERILFRSTEKIVKEIGELEGNSRLDFKC